MPPRRNDIRDDIQTTTHCPVCATGFTPNRRQRYCTPACRQAAWRTRQDQRAPPPAITLSPRVPRRDHTVYQCPECDTRHLGQQWCPDCERPCIRLDLGGLCPHCDEPITNGQASTGLSITPPNSRPTGPRTGRREEPASWGNQMLVQRVHAKAAAWWSWTIVRFSPGRGRVVRPVAERRWVLVVDLRRPDGDPPLVGMRGRVSHIQIDGRSDQRSARRRPQSPSTSQLLGRTLKVTKLLGRTFDAAGVGGLQFERHQGLHPGLCRSARRARPG